MKRMEHHTILSFFRDLPFFILSCRMPFPATMVRCCPCLPGASWLKQLSKSGLVFLLAFLVFPWLAEPAHAVTYANTSVPYNWIDASTHTKIGYNTAPYKFNGGGGCGTTPPIIDDTMSDSVPIGFTFMYGGMNFTSVRIMSNGRLQFKNNTTCGYGSPVTQLPYPNAGLNYTMRIYGNDLDPTLQSDVSGYSTVCTSRTTCYVSYATIGTAPYRSFVVTWSNVPEWTNTNTASGSYNLQIILQENGEFIYQYGADTPGPQNANAQIGWQVDTNDYAVPAFGFPANNTAIKFYIPRPVAEAEYHFDELSWNGTPNEVTDSSVNVYSGTAASLAATKPTTADAYPANPNNPGTCRYGSFNRTNKDYVALPASFPNLGANGNAFTITAWIKTTNNTLSGQRIFIDDENNTGGFGISLGDKSTGRVRFYSRGTPSQLILDTTNVITNNTWYFVAAVADVPNKTKRIYVYDTAGTKLSKVSAIWTETSFGSDSGIASIGGETNAAGENTNSFGFSGNIDEVSVFGSVLSQSAIESVLALTHPCTSSSIDHIRIEHDGDGLTCMPETVTVKACADPACATLYTGSTTVTLSGSGWTANPITFTSGSGTADLSITTPQTVTLGTSTVSPLPSHATNCYVGTTADCSLVFTDAGFIFSGSAGGAEATIPTQVAGTSSGTYYLRAVKKNYTTMACEAALAGATTVNFAYECNDPATCYAADLMSVNGGSATTIARNNNGSVSSYTSVNMTFDANGNAPFTFSYGDAGKVTLHAKKAVNSVTLTGASNAFVVKPYDFGVIPCASSVVGNCTTAPADPGLLGGGSVFAKAGAAFKTTVTARTATGTATPSFGLGSNNTTETVSLTRTRVAPTGSGTADGTLGGTTSIPRSSFTDGIATVSNLNWSEAGVVTLTATNSTFLGNALTTTGTTGNLGRFIPDHFAITPGSVTTGCTSGNFTYFGQDGFSTAFTLIAQNTANATTQNYTGNFAKFNPTAWNNYNFTAAWLPAAPNPASTLLASATAPTGTWNNGATPVIAKHLASRPAAPVAPVTITVNAKPADTDGVTMASAVAVQTAATPLRYGRIVLQNAYGPETAAIKMRLLTQYYNGAAFITSPDDTCSKYSATNLTCSNLIGPVACTDVTASGVDISNGQYFTLSAPHKTGTLLYTLAVDPWLQYEWIAPIDYKDNPTGRANFGIYRGNDRIINWREIIR